MAAMQLLVCSCNKHVDPITVNVIIEDTFNLPPPFIKDFPNEIGYKWTYYLIDTTTYEFDQDTMYVEITNDTLYYGVYPYTIWNYHISSGYSFTRWIHTSDSMAIYNKYYEEGLEPWPYIYVLFPLFTGDSADFNIGSIHHTYQVLNYDSIELHNGNKYIAYEIQNNYYFPQYGFQDKFWYVNKIGIVKYEHHSLYGLILVEELISYNFNPKN